MDAQTSTLVGGAQPSDDRQFYKFVAQQITEDLRAGAQRIFSFTVAGTIDPCQYAGLQDSVQNILGHPVHISMDAISNTVTLAQSEQRGLVPTPVAQASQISSDAAVEKSRKKIPRPANAFIIYRKDQHGNVVAANPGLHNNAISVIIGKQWKNESAEVRDLYQRKAAEAKQQHLLAHPGYQYQPRKPSEKKKRMTKNKLAKLAAAKAGIEGGATSRQEANGLQHQLPVSAAHAPMVPPTPTYVPGPNLEFVELPSGYCQIGAFVAGADPNGELAAQMLAFNDEHQHLPVNINANVNAPMALAATKSSNETVVDGFQNYPMHVAPASDATYGTNFIGNQDPTLPWWDFINPNEDFQHTFAGFDIIEPLDGVSDFHSEVHRQAHLDHEANNEFGDFFNFEAFDQSDAVQ